MWLKKDRNQRGSKQPSTSPSVSPGIRGCHPFMLANPRLRSNLHQNFFTISVVYHWNNLPSEEFLAHVSAVLSRGLTKFGIVPTLVFSVFFSFSAILSFLRFSLRSFSLFCNQRNAVLTNQCILLNIS